MFAGAGQASTRSLLCCAMCWTTRASRPAAHSHAPVASAC